MKRERMLLMLERARIALEEMRDDLEEVHPRTVTEDYLLGHLSASLCEIGQAQFKVERDL